jgi:hypothetical protein
MDAALALVMSDLVSARPTDAARIHYGAGEGEVSSIAVERVGR